MKQNRFCGIGGRSSPCVKPYKTLKQKETPVHHASWQLFCRSIFDINRPHLGRYPLKKYNEDNRDAADYLIPHISIFRSSPFDMFLDGNHRKFHNTKKISLYEWIPALVAFAFTALLPPIHIFCLWFFWQSYARNVDKRSCTCSCWDTVFKGTYESGIASYKHFYFNATQNTFKIWLLVVAFLLILYECVRWIISLWLCSRLRYSMALLFFTSLFSNYYSWWIYINYYNDEFYSQWNHQIIFTITELISTCMVLWLASRERAVTLLPAIVIAGVAVFHVIAASRDQFVINVLQGEGHAHQVVRDIGFMVPDILHVVVPLLCVRRRSYL